MLLINIEKKEISKIICFMMLILKNSAQQKFRFKNNSNIYIYNVKIKKST